MDIVLVHGAWADGSAWSGVIRSLQAEGHSVTAVQIPLTSRDADVATVRHVLVDLPGPAVLVGHSYGGAVITELGPSAPNVAGLVYVSAFVPDEGESMKGLITGGPQPPGASAIRPDSSGNLWLDRDGFVTYFAADLDPTEARVLAASQKPIAAAAFLGEEPFGPPAWRSLPCLAVVSERDQMLPAEAQRAMAGRAGAAITSVDAGHLALISEAATVAAVISTATRTPAGTGAGR